MKKLFTAIFLAAIVPYASAAIIYVDANATGANNGSSWTDAYNYLADALADASSNPTINEIRVAQGTYNPDANSSYPNGSGDREASFQLINGVTIKGGYAGFGQPEPNARDVELYETILSGDLLDNDDPCTPLDGLHDDPCRADNSYHIFYHPNGIDLNATAILDGFTITAGNADGSYPYYCSGGGVFNYEQNSPAIINCTFTGNSVIDNGSGIHNYNSSPTVTNCTFNGNYARYNGGGMCNYNNSSSTVTNCKFIGNLADAGGGIHNYESNPTVTNSTFIGNSVRSYGGGMNNRHFSNPTVTNCTFIENSAEASGGGIYRYGGGSTNVTNCKFIGNSGGWGGGGMHNESGTFTNCTFIGNSAGYGGGIYTDRKNPMVTNCTFSGNSADYGGGIYSYNNTATSFSPTVTNCTFSGNAALNGNACACNSSAQNYPGNIKMTNCILSDGGQEIWNNDGSTITISYTNLQGGQAACYDPYNAIVWSVGNINADPCFIDPGHWDTNDTPTDANDDFWVNGDCHLKSQAGRWQPSIYIDLDPTADRFINLSDFAAFANSWRKKGGSIAADMDNSGLVDSADLALLLDGYLRSYKLGLWVIDEVELTSPCIDAGDPNSDWIAELWPHGKCINMGAYGGTPQASMSPSTIGNIANLDNDPADDVDFNDLGLFINKWLKEEILIPEDLNRDSLVNFIDYAIFAEHWLN